jgi:hypothetical protein
VEIVNKIRAAGGQLEVSGANLQVRLPKSEMTPELRETLRTHKQEIIDFIRAEADGRRSELALQLPPSGPRLIDQSASLGDVERYIQLRNRIVAMVEKIAPKAQEMGWSLEQLFFTRNPKRVDLNGLVGLMEPGAEIARVAPECIEIRERTGTVLRFYRRDHSQLSKPRAAT